uniref:DUF2079 domain-containing protein n=1 Tax=mine drainage metagenome TaxID=410659 RepID=E6Q600_9ZZZZ
MTKLRVAAIALLWAAVLSVLGLWKYAIFRADVDDGIFTQVLLSFGSGFSTTAEGGVNHFLVHFSPILVLLVPLVRWVGDARALIVAQAVLSALVIFPIYGIARRRTSEGWALAIAATAMLYPVLCAAAFTDFHENAFVPLLSATLLWALDGGRYRTAALAVLGLLCTKEDQFALLAMEGIIIALLWRNDRARVRFGLLTAGAGVLFAALYFFVLRPSFHLDVPYFPLHFYDWSYVGSAPQGYAPLFSPLRPLYLLWVFVPIAFLALRSRFAWFLIPGFIEVFASHQAITLSLGTEYVAPWLGFMLVAFADGAATLPLARSRIARAWVGAAAALCVLTLAYNDPMARWYYLYRLPNAHDARLESTLRALPRGRSIGAEDKIFAHLAYRRHASLGPNGQRYFIYDRTQSSGQWRNVDRPKVRALLQAGSYRVLSERDGIVVLKRRSGAL